MSFGYSVGDILAGCTLVYDVVKLLANPKGATKEYQEAYVELLAMTEVFNQAIMVLRDQGIPQTVKNAIAHIAVSSIDVIEKFKVSAERYHREYMSKEKAAWAQAKWTQAGWIMFKKSELTKLVTQLRAQISAIIKLKSLCSPAEMKVPKSIARYMDHSSDNAQGSEAPSVEVVKDVHLPVETPNGNQILTNAANAANESARREPRSDDIGDSSKLRNDTADPIRAMPNASNPVDTRKELNSDTWVKRIVSEVRQAEQEAIKAAEAKTPKPIQFKDAVGRKFSFPFDLSKTWTGIERLIKQAFQHVSVIGPHVEAGHYDLLGPDQEIILPQIWELVIKPNTSITMVMWPMDRGAPMPETAAGARSYPLPSPVPPRIAMSGGQSLPMDRRTAHHPPPFHSQPSSSPTQLSQIPPGSRLSNLRQPPNESGMEARPPVIPQSSPYQDGNPESPYVAGYNHTIPAIPHLPRSHLKEPMSGSEMESIPSVKPRSSPYRHIGPQEHQQSSRPSSTLLVAEPGSRFSNSDDSRRSQTRYGQQQPIRRSSYSSSQSSQYTSTSSDTGRSESSSESYESRMANVQVATEYENNSDEDEFDVDETENEAVSDFIYACEEGDLRSVKQLLHEGARMDERDSLGATALHIASRHGHLRIVKYLLKHGADVSARDDAEETPVFDAARNGHLKILKLLLREDSDTLLQNAEGDTVLQMAIREGHDEIAEFLIIESNEEHPASLVKAVFYGRENSVKLLLDNGLSPSEVGWLGWSALEVACMQGSLEILELLLDDRQDIPETGHNLCSHLKKAIICHRAEVVELLLRRGTNVKGVDAAGDTALHVACQNNEPPLRWMGWMENHDSDERQDMLSFTIWRHPDLSIIKLLLDGGADTMVTNASGKTAIHYAAEKGFSDITKLLMANGASQVIPDGLGRLPIHLASQNGHGEIVEYLLQRRIDATLADNDGNTALLLAVQSGHLNIFRLLMCEISDFLAPNRQGYTTLHAAVDQGNLELVRFIVAKSAKADTMDASGTTPLHIASRNGHVHSVKYLLGCGIENSISDNHGATPLHLASQNGHAEVVDLLVSHGASVSVTDHNDETPLDVALQKDQISVVKVLLQKRQWLINGYGNGRGVR